MPQAKKGVLIKTDVASKIYLLQELEKRDKYTVIMDIDDRHLFIDESSLPFVREKIQKFKEEYAWEKPSKAQTLFPEFN